MRPTHLTALLKSAIPAHLSVLITGAPGIAKSSLVEQATKELGYDLILSHPVVSDPTDAKGLPWVAKDGDSATFLPFGELHRAITATVPTVWFLDDLGQASAAVQASFMQLLLARRVNGHALPDCVTFVAATNRRVDKAGVSGILEPVKSRFATIVELDAHPDDWCGWAIDSNLPPILIAFIRFRPDLLCAFKPSADLSNSPLPRTWHNVAKLLELNLPRETQTAAVKGAVGEGAAVEFEAFVRTWEQLPNIDGILLDPDKGKIPTDPATLYAVVTALGMKANQNNVARLGRYAERLVEKDKGEFAALLLRDAMRKDATITQTQAFVKLMVGPLGQLVSGNVK